MCDGEQFFYSAYKELLLNMEVVNLLINSCLKNNVNDGVNLLPKIGMKDREFKRIN